MKEKRTNKLSCERARAFPIERALAKLGHFPTRTNEKEAWFLSPFRSETQASFKVSKKLNRWYDHGEGIGGNVIDLVCQITKFSVSETLILIGQDQTSFSFQQQAIFSNIEDVECKITITEIKMLTHFALKDYLKSRKISIATASKLVKEVRYDFKDRSYFALGLQNESGGWEMRNKYYKNSSSPKDITQIKNDNEKLIVTEGVFDLLSILEDAEKLEYNYDFLVMNSTAFFERALEIVKEYSHIELYLDNDKNGKRTAEKLMARSNNCLDKSIIYKGYKDMNEWLVFNTKNGLGQEARDVFLLPQKQTRFTPDGRKVKKK